MTVIGNDWDEILQGEYGKDYFTRLMAAVDEEYARGTVYPPRPLVYSAMARVPYEKVRVVILGQDPYHGEGQANGMAFAVGKGVPLPPSLVNIFKEIESETGVLPDGSTLTGWASQGVLLLNTVLTVREHTPQSHADLGWQTFTDAVIESLARREEPMVFMLESVHPSPLSAYRGFFGCGHFVKANDFLVSRALPPIDWAYADDDKADYYSDNGKIERI